MSHRIRICVVAVSVVILFSALMAARWYLHPSTLSQSELWLSHAKENTTLTDTDYQVLSSFLQGQNDIRIGSSRGSSVIAPTTALFLTPTPVEDQKWMKQELNGLQDDTLAAFQRCIGNSAAVTSRFAASEPYRIGTFEEVANIETLYAHYPHTVGLVQFSCVAYSRTQRQALFWVERRMTHSGVGKFVLMEKNSRGEWVVAGEMVRWIA
jgi:hypothetical protein